jgi:hypothetical protein
LRKLIVAMKINPAGLKINPLGLKINPPGLKINLQIKFNTYPWVPSQHHNNLELHWHRLDLRKAKRFYDSKITKNN